jgi:hypothetical protein
MCVDAGLVSVRSDANASTDGNSAAVFEGGGHQSATGNVREPILEKGCEDSRVAVGHLHDRILFR